MSITSADLLASCASDPKRLAAVRKQLMREPTPVGDVDCQFAEVASDLELLAGPNKRMHYHAKGRRVKVEREAAASLIRSIRKIPRLPAKVTLTRLGKRKCDSDNIAGMCKSVRDGIADVYGVDDGSDLYQWEYGQQVGTATGIRITIEAVTP